MTTAQMPAGRRALPDWVRDHTTLYIQADDLPLLEPALKAGFSCRAVVTQPPDAIVITRSEETGFTASGDFVPLKPRKQPGGKVVHAWAVKGDADPARVRSNTFAFKGREYPEVDRAAWFGLPEARKKILKGQLEFLEELEALNP